MNRRTLLLLPLTLILSLLLCTGCARLNRLIQPDAAPALAPAPERSVALRLHAASRLNTDSQNHSLTLVTRIYKLRQRAAFEQAPFDAFLTPAAEREALGSDLLEVREVILAPNQRYEAQEKIGPEVGYIGIVGLFHSPAAQRWRLAFASAAAHSHGITLGAHGCALSVGAGAAATTAVSPSPPSCR